MTTKKTTYAVHIEVSRAVMLQYWGHPCPEFDPDCTACKAWTRWRKDGKVVVTTTEANTLDLLQRI